MTTQFGVSDVVEYTLTQSEVNQIVCEYVSKTENPSYNFDRDNPMLVMRNHPNGHDKLYVVRFVTTTITRNPEAIKQEKVKSLK